jgi:hypothetical protein
MSLRAIAKQSQPNSDRTSLNRRISDLRPVLSPMESEFLRFLKLLFSLLLCCYCLIFNILKALSSSSKNRTRPGLMLMCQESEKIRIHPAGAGEFVPEMRRLHAASMEVDSNSLINPRHSGKAQKAQGFAPAHSLFVLPSQLPARAGGGDTRNAAASCCQRGGYQFPCNSLEVSH